MAGGRKRKGSVSQTEVPSWGKSKHLSEIRENWQSILFKEKLGRNQNPGCCERVIERADWEPYGVVEPFKRWGWLGALSPVNIGLYGEKQSEEIYPAAVIEWMGTLVKQDGANPPFTTTLSGNVHGEMVTLSMETFNQLAPGMFDSGLTIPNAVYTYPTAFSLFENGPNSEEWESMISSLFQVTGSVRKCKMVRDGLVPLARVLSIIVNFNVLPRKSDKQAIRNYEIPLLHALMTGSPALSLRHIMMLNIWENRDSKDKAVIPYMRFLSAMLFEAGAIPGNMQATVEKIKPVKQNIKGLYLYRQGTRGFITDPRKEMSYEFDNGEDVGVQPEVQEEGSSEEDLMDVDQRRRKGKGRQHVTDHDWGRQQFEQQIWQREEQHYGTLQDCFKANFYMQEKYRYEDYQQSERVRHYHDLMANRPAVPVYIPVDYSQLPRPHEVGDSFVAPPYPGIPPPMFYQPPPPVQSSEQGGEASPWDMAPLAQGLYASIFGPHPSDSQ